jgi:hypothetical protein
LIPNAGTISRGRRQVLGGVRQKITNNFNRG